MLVLLAFGLLILTAVVLVAGFLAWLALRLYVLRMYLSYRSGDVRLALEFGSLSRNILTGSVHNEEQQWHARVQLRQRSLWGRSWQPPDIHWRNIWRYSRLLWKLMKKRPMKSPWVGLWWRLIKEICEQINLRQVVLNVRLGFPSYPHTGYLAAVAYPLNFTVFRSTGLFCAQLIPDFQTSGFAFENQIRCTVRGYQLLRPGYHFLRSPPVRALLRNRISRRLHRLWGFRPTGTSTQQDSGKGGNHGNTQL